jgi:hypothetical protein
MADATPAVVNTLRFVAAIICSSAVVTACAGHPAAPKTSQSYIFAWAGTDDVKGGGSDFLAVIDADTASPTYAMVVATAPVHAVGTMPHHTEMVMPPQGEWLFANGFMSGRTFLFDLDHPLAPRLAATIDTIHGFVKPHSFTRLAGGNVVATVQYGDSTRPGNPGGLVEFSPSGQLVKSASAADPAFPSAPIRVYSLDVAPAADRIVSTGSAMEDVPATPVLQVWRLSDLKLLKTLAMPKIPGDTIAHHSFEARFLPGDSTALVNSWNCGFFLVSGLRGAAPRIDPLFSLPKPRNDFCGVPALFGHFWIMPVGKAHEYVVYDVADPRHPRQVSALEADTTYIPHWMAREPHSNRIVVTSDENDHRVLVARFDSVAGVLSWDSTFRDPVTRRLGVDFARASWPHGSFGPAMPHGAIFSRVP